MRYLICFVVGAVLAMSGQGVWAHEEHAASPGGEQTLSGEVVDVFCYLSHGKDGLGKGHAGCAKKCIKSGLPVAIKVGDQLYLAAMESHDPANKTLANFAGERVTVHGKILEGDGQHLIAITKVEKSN